MRISDWSSDVCSSDLEKHYPGRVSATALQNPDFAAYAQAFGGHGERVESTEQFAPAFERALASGKPAILHCLLDQIGRASCRERVCQYVSISVVAVSLNNKTNNRMSLHTTRTHTSN